MIKIECGNVHNLKKLLEMIEGKDVNINKIYAACKSGNKYLGYKFEHNNTKEDDRYIVLKWKE